MQWTNCLYAWGKPENKLSITVCGTDGFGRAISEGRESREQHGLRTKEKRILTNLAHHLAKQNNNLQRDSRTWQDSNQDTILPFSKRKM